MNKRSVFARLILYTVEGYLEDIDSQTTYNYTFLIKLRGSIRSYMATHKFTPEEFEEIQKIADSEFMNRIREEQVDRIIFAVEILYLYVTEIPKEERAILNISDTRLKGSKALIVKDMLDLKRNRECSYDRVKIIIDDSRINAKKYFGYCEEALK